MRSVDEWVETVLVAEPCAAEVTRPHEHAAFVTCISLCWTVENVRGVLSEYVRGTAVQVSAIEQGSGAGRQVCPDTRLFEFGEQWIVLNIGGGGGFGERSVALVEHRARAQRGGDLVGRVFREPVGE